MEGLITAAIFVFALFGVPLFAVFGGASMAFFGVEDRAGSVNFAGAEFFTHRFADSPLTVTIPLFIFAGYILAESGTPTRLVRLSRAWLGWMPGGLAIVCIFASAFFTTFTGGSGITIVAIGGLLFPALLSDKYEEKFSLGLVTAGGSLGLLFPPSLPLILYAIVGGISITQLFLAGLIPGILTVVILAAYAIVIGIRSEMPRTPYNAKEAFSALRESVWEVLLPVVLVVGLISGVLRIHEAAAFAASYALVVEVWVYKDVSFRKDLPRIIRDSMTMFGAILVILATAIGFTGYLIDARVPDLALDLLTQFISGPIAFLLILNIFLLIVGMLMDVFSAIVVVVPLVVPIALNPAIGVDPYHLGIVFLLNLEIGYLTPPVGLNLFISSLRFDKPVTLLYRAVLPFIGLLLIALLIVTYVPLWFPAMLLPSDEVDTINLQEPAELETETPNPEDDPLLQEIMGGDGDDGLTLDDLGDDDGDFTLDDLGDDDGSFTLDDLGDESDLTLDDLGDDADLTLDDLGDDADPPPEDSPSP
ncbi:MAG: TRAP transporter large permease subunit [Myxococcota bacterium]